MFISLNLKVDEVKKEKGDDEEKEKDEEKEAAALNKSLNEHSLEDNKQMTAMAAPPAGTAAANIKFNITTKVRI